MDSLKQNVFKQDTVLVLGGAGFIGSHLCDQLVKDHNVICIDNFVTSSQSNITHLLRNRNFVFIRHDINTPLDLESIPELERFSINIAGIKSVYHLACPTSPKNFEKHRIQTVLTNSLGTRNALDIALKYEASFLLASSCVVYGGAEEGNYIFNEDMIGCVDNMGPRACYDEGKRFAETMAMTYRDFYKLDVKIARIFRTYGPRMPLNDGQMIPDFIIHALDNKPLFIYGEPSFSSSFCYVSDVVGGIIKLMNSDLKKPVNIGSPDSYLIKEVAEYIIGLLNSKSVIKYEPPLTFMRPLGLPDITLAKETFSWFPIVTMMEGLRRTVEYTVAHKDLIGFKSE